MTFLDYKVSIIVPVYNTAFRLENCLQSILNQTYKNIEIILINDGSTDNSKDICEFYAANYKNIILINQSNCGPSVARNKGIEACTGSFIQFVDSDDTINSDMTEKIVLSMKYNIQLVICGYKYTRLKRYNNIIPNYIGTIDIDLLYENFGLLYGQWVISTPCNKLYLSKIIKNNNIYFNEKEKIGEDLLFNLQYLRYCTKVNIIPDVLYNYVNRNNSLTNTYRHNLFLNQKMLYKNIRSLLIKKNSYNKQNELIEYTGSIVQAFRKFRASLSGKTEHCFPDRVQLCMINPKADIRCLLPCKRISGHGAHAWKHDHQSLLHMSYE